MNSRGNQRPPMLAIQNKSENTGNSKLKNKMVDQNCKFIFNLFFYCI